MEAGVLGAACGCVRKIPIAVGAEGRNQHEDNETKNEVTRSEAEDQCYAAKELERNGDIGKEGWQPAQRKRVGNGFNIEEFAIAAAHEDPGQKDTSGQEQNIGRARGQAV